MLGVPGNRVLLATRSRILWARKFCDDAKSSTSIRFVSTSSRMGRVDRTENAFGVLPAEQRRGATSLSVSETNTSGSVWSTVPTAPPDKILGLTAAFREDKNERKVNLGVGAYRTEEGTPYVLPVVRRMEQKLAYDTNANHEYIPQDGLKTFSAASARLVLGNNAISISERRVASIQALSGTGSLRVALAFLKDFYNAETTVYLPTPSWANHQNIVVHSGLPTPKQYRYYDDKSRGIDMDGLLEDLTNAPKGSVILFHASCHNPTGCDLTLSQWESVLGVVRNRSLIPLLDCAYQGFGSGSLATDAAAVRLFEAAGIDMMVACSFAKNMGLYGERVGALHFVCKTAEPVAAVLSQMKSIVRAMYSSPPAHGARIAEMILNDEEAFEEWEAELLVMSGRIKSMRKLLKNALNELGTPGNWDHIITQIGMFSFTGLTPEDCDFIRNKYSIYMTRNGRISMAGLNEQNVKYVAEAIHDAITRENTEVTSR